MKNENTDLNYGVIFDMDGVLIDSAQPHFQSWRLLAEENGCEMPESLFWETFGKTNNQILPLIFKRVMSENELRKFSDRKEALYRDIIRGKVTPLPGLIKMIGDLGKMGIKFAIGSSGPRLNVELAIKELGFEKALTGYTCSEDVTRGKPHPEVFLKAAEKLQIPPKRCLVFEDSLHGIEAARRAGMKCIAITTTNHKESVKFEV
ncbi:HAD family phosphatase [Candidatus Sumerlaeota bacterium]|nr:HAD family phosphatase [Candidatus Sumerlaeota bacterium]